MSHSCSTAFFVGCALLCIAVAANAIDFSKPCEEGKHWKDDCHTCHCSNGRPVCTRELCDSEAPATPVLPTPLSGATTEKTSCTPGEKWMEDCNNCICDNEGEPECSRRLCGRPSKKNPLK
uniref:Protease inhibitor n=1 Tax=Lygus hesperus TaxID=30085 RepID=A0A146KQG9_LYGHE